MWAIASGNIVISSERKIKTRGVIVGADEMIFGDEYGRNNNFGSRKKACCECGLIFRGSITTVYTA